MFDVAGSWSQSLGNFLETVHSCISIAMARLRGPCTGHP